ncbi:olfactory receptor 5C1-like [Sphaerodactylus townsendi]|uniref:olfactory receptor 5C1-like n=1 Tax=Sphaerodactylus townsendi TaxID=933632 RepID=UPI002025CCD1|nr:olfactory receptor 5C1-like [Sphaerodactylus townsendi]
MEPVLGALSMDRNACGSDLHPLFDAPKNHRGTALGSALPGVDTGLNSWIEGIRNALPDRTPDPRSRVAPEVPGATSGAELGVIAGLLAMPKKHGPAERFALWRRNGHSVSVRALRENRRGPNSGNAKVFNLKLDAKDASNGWAGANRQSAISVRAPSKIRSAENEAIRIHQTDPAATAASQNCPVNLAAASPTLLRWAWNHVLRLSDAVDGLHNSSAELYLLSQDLLIRTKGQKHKLPVLTLRELLLLRNDSVSYVLGWEVRNFTWFLLLADLMAHHNNTRVTEFILLGFTSRRDIQLLLFSIFLLIYLLGVVGNLGLVILIRAERTLHTPMYYFLSHLALMDLCTCCTVAPKMLLGLLKGQDTIPIPACALQMFFFAAAADAVCCLLAVMAYDRYAAICRPLHYGMAMPQHLCCLLVAVSYAVGAASGVIHTSMAFRLPFCGARTLDAIFCDIPPVLGLICGNTDLNELLLFAVCGGIQSISLVAIMASYGMILFTVGRAGSQRAISTCGSHLTSVGVLYGTQIYMYMRPDSTYAPQTDKMTSFFYTVVIPTLNPAIYSLRNTDVKQAIRRRFSKQRH